MHSTFAKEATNRRASRSVGETEPQARERSPAVGVRQRDNAPAGKHLYARVAAL
jgi:hypothetical protein